MSKIAKVPVVMQMEALECGAASLCMVLAYYGKWIPLEQIRSDCGVSRDGSNAKNILLAARMHGLKAKGYRLEPSELRGIAFPAIIHWNFNHFVVVNGFKKDKVIINDPGRGTVAVPLDEFDKAFTGIVLRFEKSDDFVPSGKPRSILKFALKRLEGGRPAIIFVMLTSILTALTGMVIPIFSKIFMDNILSEQNYEWIPPFVFAMGVTILFQFTLAVIESLNWLRINGRFAITANAEFMWHVLRLPMEFFSQRWAGDIAVRQSSNGAIASVLIQKTAPVLVNIAFLVCYLLIMIRYSIPLTAIGIFSVALNAAAGKYRSSKIINLSRKAQMSAGKLAGMTTSGIEMIETIKASGSESGFFGRWSGYFAQQHNAKVEITRFALHFDTFRGFLLQLTNIGILMTGVYLILNENFTIGMLLAFQGFLSSFMQPVGELIDASESFVGMRVDMERVEDVLNYRTDTNGNVTSDDRVSIFASGENGAEAPADIFPLLAGKLTGGIEIKNLTFGYSKLDPPLIKDFSIRIEPGASVAFVGASGCGKSTLAKLITGLYKPWEGEILFDGKKREDIDEYSFRSSVTMVDQEITIFEDTVANNIRMWDNAIEDFTVTMAARDADIHDTIITRKDGYGHIVQEGGRNFSGGQKQRLEIARVLAVEPTVIVLDEATSALDAKTEGKVMASIRNIDATCIVIAHRLSTIRDCDEILVLENGLVVERGTHEELLKMNGKYTELISTE